MPTTVSPPLHLTPIMPSASEIPSLSTQKPFKRVWKRFRSSGELARRRKRKFDYLSRMPPITPHSMESDALESRIREKLGRRLD